MNIQEIRQQLHEYIEYAGDEKIQALHTMLKSAGDEELSKEDWTILQEEVVKYDAGDGESYPAKESLHLIRSKSRI